MYDLLFWTFDQVEKLGLPLAVAAWVTVFGGAILSAQLFAYYLSERARLFPARASGLFDFIRGFGGNAPRRFGLSTAALAFFAFLFAMLGPYFFYIAFMKSIGDSNEEFYASLPSPPVTIVIYLMFLLAAFFAESWRAFRAAER